MMALGIQPVQIKRDLDLSDYQYREYSILPQVVEFSQNYRENMAKEDGDKIRDWQMSSVQKIYESVCRLADKDKLSESFMKEFITLINKIKGIERLEGVVEEDRSRSMLKMTEKTTRKLTGVSAKETSLLPSSIPLPALPQKPKPLWSEEDFETAEETTEREVEYQEGEIVDEDSDGD